MEELVSGLRNANDKLSVLRAFNSAHSTFSSVGIPGNTINDCLDEVFNNIDNEDILEELLLCCKTLARDRTVSMAMTPHLFVRLLEKAQLTNIHQDTPYTIVTLQARRAVFNITYHNSLCQAACFEAQADLNLFNELQAYRNSLDYDHRLINCKMAFLFTAVNESMRARVADYNGVKILTDIMIKVVYDTQPIRGKIKMGNRRQIKEDCVTLTIDDVMIVTDVYMAVFNLTLHWDKQDHVEDQMECTSDILRFLQFISCFYSGLHLSEKNEVYKNMVAKFMPIMINSAAQFGDQMLPKVDDSVKTVKFMGRDMSVPRALLKHLELEYTDKNHGNKMVLMSILSILNKLCSVRECRKYLRKEILPTLGKVTKRPEEYTDMIKSKVVKLMTHVDNSVAVLASELLFIVCKYNVNRMIKYTGYGNSAGLFNRHGLMTLNNTGKKLEMSEDEDSDTEEYRESEKDLDLVTAGPAQENTALLNMTEEEKMYEANKLMNLIDDMHRKGVIKPGGLGADGKVKEVDIAAQLANIPDPKSDSEDDEDDLKLDSTMFFPRKKPGKPA